MRRASSLSCLLTAIALGAVGLTSPASAADAAPEPPTAAPVAAPPSQASTRGPKPNQPTPPPAADGELVSLRTEKSRTYVDDKSGLRTTKVSQTAVNFQDGDGDWQKINTALVPDTGGGVRTTAGPVVTRIPADLASGAVVTSSAAGSVSLRLQGAAASTATVAGDTATFSGVAPKVDVRATAAAAGVRADLILADATAPTSFTYDLTTTGGITPALAADGGISLTGAGGSAAGWIPAPSVLEAGSTLPVAKAARYTLTGSGSAWTLTTVVDPAWLTAAGRQFPVTVDPDVYLTSPSDATTCDIGTSAVATTCHVYALSVGSAGSTQTAAASAGTYRGLVKFGTLGSALPVDATILDARLKLRAIGNLVNARTQQVSVYGVTAPWTNPGGTWTQRTSGTNWTTPGGDFDATATSTVTTPGLVGFDLFPVTKLVTDWVSGARANNGLLLKAVSEPAAGYQTNDYCDSTCSSGTPELDIVWTASTGLRSAQQYYDVTLTDNLAVHVNLASGNLVVQQTDLAVTGPGLSTAVTRTWNSRDSYNINFTGAVAKGWSTNYGFDEFAVLGSLYAGEGPYDGGIRVRRADGHWDLYWPKAGGGYTTPPGAGDDLTLTGSGSGSTITLTKRSDGTKRTYTWNTTSYYRLTSIADRNGLTQTVNYKPQTDPVAPDGEHRLQSSIVDTAGRTLTVNSAYDAGLGNARVTGLSDAAGRTVSYTRTGAMLTDVTGVTGGHTTYDYVSGQLHCITDEANHKVCFSYNGDRVSSMTRELDAVNHTGPSTYFTYTDPTTPTGTGTTVVSDPLTHVATYTWDRLDHVTSVLDALNHMRSATFGSDENITTAVDAMGVGATPGNTTTYSYDGDNRLMSAAAPASASGVLPAKSTATYAEAAGTVTNRVSHWQPASSTSSDGNTTTLTYDSAGNVMKAKDTTTGGGATQVSFTRQGDAVAGGGTVTCGGKAGQPCSVTDGNGHTTKYSYDAQGNLVTVTQPVLAAGTGTQLGTTFATYDTIGRPSTSTDGKGQVTRFCYDSAGRVLQQRIVGTATCGTTPPASDFTAGNVIVYTYDGTGSPLTRRDVSGTITYGYDLLGRQIKTTYPDTSVAQLSYDLVGNVIAYTDPTGVTFYDYNADNSLKTITAPGGNCGATPRTRCISYGYNANGARTSITLPATTTTLSYNKSGGVTQITSASGATTLVNLGYTYTDSAVTKDTTIVQTRKDNVGVGGPVGSTTTYGYDTLDRLTSAVEKTSGGTPNASWAYTYDNAGNRLTDTTTVAGGSTVTNTNTYNNNDELITRNGSSAGWTYDANGNQTAGFIGATANTWTYNNIDQATSSLLSGTTTSYTYAGSGNKERLSSTVGGLSTTFRNSPVGVSTRTTTGATDQYIRDPRGTPVAWINNGNVYYYLYDNLGSVVAIVDTAGARVASYSYDPYGQTRTILGTTGGDLTFANANPLRYVGGYLDTATGFYKLGYRYYNPAIGRFTQPDPSGQEANDYAYAGNSPCNATDLTGLISAKKFAQKALQYVLDVLAVPYYAIYYFSYRIDKFFGIPVFAGSEIYGILNDAAIDFLKGKLTGNGESICDEGHDGGILPRFILGGGPKIHLYGLHQGTCDLDFA